MRLFCRASVCFVFCITLILGTGRGLAQTTFSTVVVFGDSLSDTGNIAHLTQAATLGAIRYPSDIPLLGIDYTDGRFTDGKDTQPAAQAYFGVWIEQLAASFAAKPAVTDSLDGGTNFAYGDATTGNGTTTVTEGPLSITLDNMGQQVMDYLGRSPAPMPNAATLYVLWGGANDIYDAVSAAAANNGDTTAAATSAATTAVANEVALIQELVQAGASNFMVPNLPPLGGVPQYATGANSTALNTGAAIFAQGLAQALASLKTGYTAQGVTVTLYQPDIFSLFGTIAMNPMSVGLGNVTSAAQNISGSPDPYLIWDGLHPTTTGHHLAAATAANLLTPLVASTTALITASTTAVALAGQPVSLSVKVSPGTGATSPSGLVTFYSGTAAVGSTALDSSGMGGATLAGSTLVAGSYSITAVYAGDTTYKVSASAAQPLTILSSAVGTTTALSAALISTGTGQQAQMTATVSPATSTYGAPTGTVTFYDGTTSLGTGALTNGVATLTSATLSTGPHSLTASYAASGIFAGSTSTPVSETVVAPGFTATLNPTSLTIKAGGSGATVLGTTDAGGFSGTLTPSCGTLPAHMACSFVVNTVPLPAGQMQWTLTVATNAATTAALELSGRPGEWRGAPVLSATAMFAGTLLLGFRRRRRQARRLAALALAMAVSLGAILGVSGCGANNDTRTGTYTVPVIVTPGSGSSVAAQTVNLSVTVQ